MNIVDKVKEFVIEECEKYKESATDHYNFWNEHIKYVYEESIDLANMYNADLEIVSLGALLHDIALIEKVGDKKDHHVNGEIIAKKILEDFNYENDKKERVLKCVYNHRSSKNAESIEEMCVADADVLAHFDNIPMLFNSAYVRNNVSLNEVRKWMSNVFEEDYNDLSEKTKVLFKDKYKQIREIVLKR